MKVLIVGGAGFIGSSLTKKLLSDNYEVLVIDKLSLGSRNNLNNTPIKFYEMDINDTSAVLSALGTNPEIDEIWHLAANSDISAGVNDINIDLNDTFMSTFSILEIMKKINCKVINFASSSAIYGINKNRLNENIGPLFPISHYGAMKLSSEALISSSLESFLERANIYRFPNVVGVPATHGVILDLIKKLKINKKELSVLGNGMQQKTYLHVSELIEAMIFINKNSKQILNFFNIGAMDDGITVKDIAEEVVRVVSPNAKIKYQSSDRGWVGDVPKFIYSIEKIKKLGWSPKMSSYDAVKKAILEIANQEGF